MMTQGPFRLLHVGCGSLDQSRLPAPFNQPHWQEVRLDIDPGARPDILASITDMEPVADASVDAVYSAHNIEHLLAHEVGRALAEFHRVLAPGGLAVVTTPNLQKIAEAVAAGRLTETVYTAPAGPVTPLDMLYGYRPRLAEGHIHMAHRTGFTAASLGEALREAGFASIAVCPDQEWAIWAVASRGEDNAEEVRQIAASLAQRA